MGNYDWLEFEPLQILYFIVPETNPVQPCNSSLTLQSTNQTKPHLNFNITFATLMLANMNKRAEKINYKRS
jgi:hypothetical protein